MPRRTTVGSAAQKAKKNDSPEWDRRFFRTPMKPQRPAASRRRSPLVGPGAKSSTSPETRPEAPAFTRMKKSLSSLWQRIVRPAAKGGSTGDGQRAMALDSGVDYVALGDSPASSTKLYSPFAIETPPEQPVSSTRNGHARKLVYAD